MGKDLPHGAGEREEEGEMTKSYFTLRDLLAQEARRNFFGVADPANPNKYIICFIGQEVRLGKEAGTLVIGRYREVTPFVLSLDEYHVGKDTPVILLPDLQFAYEVVQCRRQNGEVITLRGLL